MLGQGISRAWSFYFWFFDALEHLSGGVGDAVLFGDEAKAEPEFRIRLFDVQGIHGLE